MTVGAILPLSGDSASYGQPLREGMELALAEVNAEATTSSKALEIVYEDDANLAKNGVMAFKKLVSVDKVPLVIGPMFSAVALAIAPEAQREKVVLLSPSASAVELSAAGDYFFRIYPSDTYDGEFLGKYATNNLRLKSVYIAALNAASTRSVSDVFAKTIREAGGTVLGSDYYAEGTSDFRGIIANIQRLSPQAVFLPGSLREMALFLRQAMELGVKTQFISISTFYDPKIHELAGSAANGVIFSCPAYDATSTSPSVQSFVTAYRRKHDGDPGILAAYGYDVVKIAAKAVRDAADGNARDIRSSLSRLRAYSGVTGRMSFDKNGDVQKELQIMTVKNGRFTAVRSARE